jgi:hypothetical protein
MKFSKLFLVVCSVFLVVSCSNNDDVPQTNVPLGAYEKGFLVLNEGNQVEGTVTYVSNDLTTVTQDIYGLQNKKDGLGGYIQSIFFDGDRAYIISGSANKITVVNRYTFKLIAKIESQLYNPRYGVVKDGKAYVTNAHTYYSKNNDTGEIKNPNGNTDDYVAVINLATNTVESKIELNATANRILLENDKLYITEPYNNTNLLVVNTTTKALETPVNVDSGADTMALKSGVLYVLTNTGLKNVKVSDKSVTKLDFPSTLTGATNLTLVNDTFYFTHNNNVFSSPINAVSISQTPLFSVRDFPYGFAVFNNKIYYAIAPDFTLDGSIFIYSINGNLEKEIKVGLGPNSFYFN